MMRKMAEIDFDAGFMYRWRGGPDMVYDELTILAIFGLQALVLLWQLKLKKEILIADFEEILAGAIDDLDGRLAQALGSIAENMGFSNVEPPNPFQQLIAQYIQSKVQESSSNDVTRSENGQFKSLKDEILDSD
jgi:hypothetical protein